MPKISVVMPAWNAGETLSAAIESILNQTFRDIELIIINDNSTDNTSAIIDFYAENDKRIIPITSTCKGAQHARNIGIAKASSPYIAAMDADDISLPGRLEKQIEWIQRDDSLVAIGTEIEWFGEKSGRPLMVTSKNECRTALGLFSPLCHPSSLFKTDAIQKVGGYAADKQTSNDYDIYSRLSRIGEIENMKGIGLRYRVHKQQISQSNKKQQIADMIDVLRSHHNHAEGKELSDAQLLAHALYSGLRLGPKHIRQSLRAFVAITKYIAQS